MNFRVSKGKDPYSYWWLACLLRIRSGRSHASFPPLRGRFVFWITVTSWSLLRSHFTLLSLSVPRFTLFQATQTSSKKTKKVETKIWGHAWESNTEPPGRRRQRTNQLSSGNAGFWIVKYLSAKEIGSLPTLLNLGNVFLYQWLAFQSFCHAACLCLVGLCNWWDQIAGLQGGPCLAA